uniref:Prostate and testis expressed 3 n=1 Tax=Monodon monoceros TaxID=40151 RepID=A0A8C6CAQ1_MONMO
MDKHFLLLSSVFSCIAAVTPLRCITCHLRTQTDRCRRGFGVCAAEKKHETCMILKIFQDNTLQLSYMVCQRFCRELTYDLNDTYVHTCCNDNYCNFKI